MLKVKDTLKVGYELLKQEYKSDARVLLAYVMGIDSMDMIFHMDEIISEEDYYKYEALLQTRKQGKPLAYITNSKEFYNHTFFVNESVLIPRYDSETLVEAVLKDYKEHNTQDKLKILELGVGSGCLIISIMLGIPHSIGVGIDISSKAVDVAKYNMTKFSLQDRLNLSVLDWNDIQEATFLEKFDIIISNPPYIGIKDKIDSQLKYEPQAALFSPYEGFGSYFEIVKILPYIIKENTALYLEIGYGMSEVLEIFKMKKHSCSYQDISNTIRCLKFVL